MTGMTQRSVHDSPAPESTAPVFEIEGNRLSVLPDGPAAWKALLALIEGAKAQLQLHFYIFADDEAGTVIRDALAAAAARGVRVSLIIDGFGSDGTPEDFFATISDAGGTVCRFSPRWGRRYLLRNHQKMAIADGACAIVGGFNIERSYFDPDDDKAWRDLGLAIEGPAAAHLSRYYDELHRWAAQKRATMRQLRRIVRDLSQRHGAVRWLIAGPTRRLSPFTHRIKNDLRRARRLWMMMAYFSPNWAMLRRIERIGDRGQATIVTAGKSDNNTTISAARHTYRRLLSHGVRLFEYQPRALHAKLIVLEGVTYVGSANFDMRSLYLNMEIMLRVRDERFARHMRGLITAELPNSMEIDQALFNAKASWWRRLIWTISYFLVATVDFGVSRRLNLGDDQGSSPYVPRTTGPAAR